MSSFIVDDIGQNLTGEQVLKLSEMQAKVDHLQNLPDFSKETLADPANHKTKNVLIDGTEAPIKFDSSLLKTRVFQQALGTLTPALFRDNMWKNVKHDDPDTLILRHLRARNWDVDKAFAMMVNSIRWRYENGVNSDLLAGGDLKIKELADGDESDEKKVSGEVLAQLRSGKSFTQGTDVTGRPLLFIRVLKHNPSAQDLKGLERYIVFQAETARLLLRAPNTTVAIVFDLGGFTMGNMDWNAIRLLTLGLEDKYPESMGRTYVYRAPWMINGIWRVVKRWMPGEEASKVRFINDAQQLSEFVDLKNLPTEMGGTDNWEYDYIEPKVGENDLLKDTATRDDISRERDELIVQYEAATREWLEQVNAHSLKNQSPASRRNSDESAREKMVARAKEGGAENAMVKRRELVTKLRANYWKLDPYIRGRTHLDRAGQVKDAVAPPAAAEPAAPAA